MSGTGADSLRPYGAGTPTLICTAAEAFWMQSLLDAEPFCPQFRAQCPAMSLVLHARHLRLQPSTVLGPMSCHEPGPTRSPLALAALDPHPNLQISAHRLIELWIQALLQAVTRGTNSKCFVAATSPTDASTKSERPERASACGMVAPGTHSSEHHNPEDLKSSSLPWSTRPSRMHEA